MSGAEELSKIILMEGESVEEFISAGYTEEQASEMAKCCDMYGIPYIAMINATRNLNDLFTVFKEQCKKAYDTLIGIVGYLEIDKDFSHNWHMANHSKKKRVRKKYAKKLIK